MSSYVKDITGNKYGLLTVIEYVGIYKKQSAWRCICECGGETVVERRNLICGGTKSCGCLHLKQSSELCKKRNTTHGYSKEPLYFVWKTMRQRCYNPKQHDYKWYGAKGVKICEEWDSYINFRNWA